MKTILLAALMASLMQAEAMVQEHSTSTVSTQVGSGLTVGGSPKQQFEFYTFIMSIGSRFAIGTFSQVTYYGNDNGLTPLITVGPQVDYQPGSSIDLFVRSGKDMGDDFTPQKVGRFSLTAGVRIGEADLAKGIKKGWHKLFH
jgi:hypothetical protein